MKVASFIENGNVDEIDTLLINEMKAHGNEAEVMCCIKVIYFWKYYTVVIWGYPKGIAKGKFSS